eukprot:TRINITY_DN10042_c0_g1_i3.p1 TRINITY_DN10042_c0_g1~~TRINITY_DN10042_c0_g1_i3.p1  ORF type:complete len:802 (+),score=246.01 TRINITY_DN10042_c0_g1_i3:74-2479(+)
MQVAATRIMMAKFCFFLMLGIVNGRLLYGTDMESQNLATEASSATSGSPVGKVVTLMKEIQGKVQEEADMEEDMFENYTCWSKRSTKEKEEAIQAAESRIKMLNQRIMELKSMKGSESGEAAKLKDQLQEVKAEINATETQRNTEEAKNKENIETTTSAVNGLDEAKKALDEVVNLRQRSASLAHGASLLQQLRGSRSRTMSSEALAKKATDLEYGLSIAEQHLSAPDALFLRRILTADITDVKQAVESHKKGKEDPPDVAPVKEDYQARSGEILGTLNKLSGEFSTDLKKTKESEKKSKESFNKLMDEKENEKQSLEEAARNQIREKEAREYKTKEAEKEIAKLEEQIGLDNEFIEAVAKAQDQKQKEWDQRSKVRSEELTAIAKAIETLHNDEARDTMNKAYGFLQLSSVAESSSFLKARATATAALKSIFHKTKDSRMLGLYLQLSTARTSGHFDSVFAKIDEMVKVLDEEEASDLEKKTQCEDDLAKDTATSEKTTEDIEHLTAEITSLKDDVEEIKLEIMNKKREIAEIANELEQSAKMREEEAAEYQEGRATDEQGMATIEKAAEVISSFYASNALIQTDSSHASLIQSDSGPVDYDAAIPVESESKHVALTESGSVDYDAAIPVETNSGSSENVALIQSGSKSDQPDLGAAPGTWESGEEYKGNQEGGGRISALMDEVKADLQKDMDSAKLCEENAQKMYDDAKESLTKQTENLHGEIDTLMETKGEKTTSSSEKETETETKKSELKALKNKMADVKPECDFFIDKYPARKANRETEKEGLDKAKEILEKYDSL